MATVNPASQKIKPASNIYTVLLALATLGVAAAGIYVAVICWMRYETILKVM